MSVVKKIKESGPPPTNKNRYITLSVREYIELREEISKLKAFAKILCVTSPNILEERLKELYEEFIT